MLLMNSIIKKWTGYFIFILVIMFLLPSLLAVSAQESFQTPITNIWYKKVPDYTRIAIKSAYPITDFESMYLDDPARIVVDIHQADFQITELVKNTLKLYMGSVKRVRCGQFEEDSVRFVVDLFQKTNYDISLDPTGKLLILKVYDQEAFKTPEEQTYTVQPLTSEDKPLQEKVQPSLLEKIDIPITLNFKETEVVDALRALSEIGGINIIIDDSVSGNVTVNLKDVLFKDAIELILNLKGLGYTEKGNTLIIASNEVISGYTELTSKLIVLNNTDAKEARGILESYLDDDSLTTVIPDTRTNSLLIKGPEEDINELMGIIKDIDSQLLRKTFKINNAFGLEEIKEIQRMLSIVIPEENRVIVDTRLNEIIVEGSQEEINNAEAMINGLDKRAPQIMIEAKIVEITLDAEKDLGITWTSGETDAQGNVVPGEIILGEISLGGSFERQNLIKAKLDILTREGETNILSNPKILTLDGKKAVILSGQKIPIREINEEGYETVKYLDVGLNMTITPRLSNDEKITMECDIKVESLGAELIQGYPIINSRQEQAIIRSPLGITNVIGGLITSEEIESITKIPLLGDIPIFGELFKFTDKSNKKTQIIILITARKMEY